MGALPESGDGGGPSDGGEGLPSGEAVVVVDEAEAVAGRIQFHRARSTSRWSGGVSPVVRRYRGATTSVAVSTTWLVLAPVSIMAAASSATSTVNASPVNQAAVT